MDEGLDVSVDSGVESDGIDVSASDSVDVDIDVEPLVDMPVEEVVSEDLNDAEPPISEDEFVELQNEAETLEIQPLDDGIDLGYNYDEAIQEANETWAAESEAYKPSTLENIINAGAAGMISPSDLAQVGAAFIAPDGAEDVVAQGLQGGTNAAIAASEGFMEAAHDQHAFPAAPMEGVDFIRNENGEPEPISQMVNTTDENGESIWIRPPDGAIGE